jgi:hypothetical protein
MAMQSRGQAKAPTAAHARVKSEHPNEIRNGRLSLSPNALFTALRYSGSNGFVQI